MPNRGATAGARTWRAGAGPERLVGRLGTARARALPPAGALALALSLTLTSAGCGGGKSASAQDRASQNSGTPAGAGAATPSSPAAPSGPSAPATTSSPAGPGSMNPESSSRLAPALLTLGDLPSGFRTRPLTLRNLPSLIHGCPGLEELQQAGIADQAQAEWTRGALDAYLDEAVIEPRNDTAANLVAKTAKALDDCGTVQVVEEGISVTLTATPLALPPIGDASHAWHTTGRLVLPMQMNVVLIQQGGLVVLVAQTRVGGDTDDALTEQVARAAAKKAAVFQG